MKTEVCARSKIISAKSHILDEAGFSMQKPIPSLMHLQAISIESMAK
jgi:hypothetical protein